MNMVNLSTYSGLLSLLSAMFCRAQVLYIHLLADLSPSISYFWCYFKWRCLSSFNFQLFLLVYRNRVDIYILTLYSAITDYPENPGVRWWSLMTAASGECMPVCPVALPPALPGLWCLPGQNLPNVKHSEVLGQNALILQYGVPHPPESWERPRERGEFKKTGHTSVQEAHAVVVESVAPFLHMASQEEAAKHPCEIQPCRG